MGRYRSSVRVETSVPAVETDLFWDRLDFPVSSLAPIPLLAVARLPMPPFLREYHGVVGRDLLSRWESFHYEGRLARFTIRYTRGGLFGWLK